MREYYLKDLTL